MIRRIAPLIVLAAALFGASGCAPVFTSNLSNGVFRPQPVRVAANRPAPVVTGKVVVQNGEFVSLIAKRQNVSTQALIDVNGLKAPYTVYPGQVLLVPGTDTRYAQIPPSVTAPKTGVAPAPQIVEAPLPPLAEQQVAGPFSSIRATGREIIEVTPLPPPSMPAPAQTSSIPASPPEMAVIEPAPLPPPIPQPLPEQAPQAKAVPTDLPTPPPVSGRGFIWPVDGPVLSDFGPKGGGMHNDGINIAANRGAAVRAAEAGTIVYAGNEMRGFGNLLLIQHEDGFVTAYAHNETLLVKRGDRVKRAQTIARVGATGNVATPQLHFEIRRGNRAVNPMDHLTASRARVQVLKDGGPAAPLSPG